MVLNFVMGKRRFSGVFCTSTAKKSDFSYENGKKTYDILKIKLISKLLQKELALNIEMGRNENFIRQLSALCNQDLEM